MLHYSFLGYLLATGVVLLACTLMYRWLLQSKASPGANRVAVLSIYALTFLVPALVALVPYDALPSTVVAPDALPYIDVEGTATAQDAEAVDVAQLMLWIYLSGCAILLVLAMTNVARLSRLRRNSEKWEMNGEKVYVHSDAALSSFSWFTKIFIYKPSMTSSVEERDILMMHERAHVALAHWADLLVANAVVVFQWFNPAAWMLQKELQRIHEYQADASVLAQGVEATDYQMLLIKNISRSRFIGLTDGLNNCSLKQRIIMMQKQTSSRKALWRGCGVAAIAVVAGIALHSPAIAAVTGEIEAPQPAQKKSTVMIRADKQAGATSIDIDNTTWLINGVKVTHDKVASLNPDDIQSMTVNKENEPRVEITLKPTAGGVADTEVLEEIMVVSYSTAERTGSDKTAEPKKSSMTVKQSAGSPRSVTVDGQEVEIKEVDGAYNAAEEMPQYPGGLSQLMADLAMRVKYPASENREGVTARVVLQFIVNTEGHISNLKVIRPQGEAFDNAALEAVKSLNATWVPGKIDGKPVNVWFTLPITFQTKGVNNTSVNASIGPKAI